jgi:hypothetical protein
MFHHLFSKQLFTSDADRNKPSDNHQQTKFLIVGVHKEEIVSAFYQYETRELLDFATD